MTKLEGEIGLARRGGFITFGEDLMYKLERKLSHCRYYFNICSVAVF